MTLSKIHLLNNYYTRYLKNVILLLPTLQRYESFLYMQVLLQLFFKIFFV